ncbi:MAG: iron-sulfur cluster repair di-iron protein [Planctomycetes bacterium]|nr:iron-sulfur cluster repair di-iron protein [Planctomycetota bacterium]
MTYSTETTLADLATRLPAASRVLHHHGLDYCCGGRRSLTSACEERGLDAGRVLAEIEGAAAASDAPRWDSLSLGDLVRLVLTRFHEPLRSELPQLVAMARKVEAVHAEKDGCPRGLGAHLAVMASSLEEHMQKEEQVLFPLIMSGRGASAAMPVGVMMQEHDDHALNLRQVRRLTDDLTPPPEACSTWQALYLRLDELERDIMEHVHLENHVLFPRALQGTAVSAEGSKEVE